MTIHEYIQKHGIAQRSESSVNPDFYPVRLFSKKYDPSFIGSNVDRTKFVALYDNIGKFVVVETNAQNAVVRSISDEINVDRSDLY